MAKFLMPLFGADVPIQEIILKALESSEVRLIDSQHCPLNEAQIAIVGSKLKELIKFCNASSNCILIRGIDKPFLKARIPYLGDQIPYDIIFRVGEKAKNYLEAEDDNKTLPINEISKRGERFRRHSEGINRWEYLISATTSSEVAAHNFKEKVFLVFWIPEGYNFLIVSPESIKAQNPETPFVAKYSEEQEISINGIIFPDFLFCIIDLDVDEIAFHPELFEEKEDWLEEGFPIGKASFEQVLEECNYERMGILSEDGIFVNVLVPRK